MEKLHECKERPAGDPSPNYDAHMDHSHWRIEISNGYRQWYYLYVKYCPYCGEELP